MLNAMRFSKQKLDSERSLLRYRTRCESVILARPWMRTGTLRVNVPGVHETFCFTDNFEGRTAYIGNGLGKESSSSRSFPLPTKGGYFRTM